MSRDGALYLPNHAMFPLLALDRSFLASARGSIAASVPDTRSWCTLEVVVQGFGSSFDVPNIDDIKRVIGLRAYKSFFVERMGAIEHQYCGIKTIFIPGSSSAYFLNLMVSFLNELDAKVGMRLLVASAAAEAAAHRQRKGH